MVTNFKIDFITDKKSTDGTILTKIRSFKNQVDIHEKLGLNILRKSPLISACDREVSYLDRHGNKINKALMFGSNSYLGATIFEKAKNKANEVIEQFGIGSGGVPLLSGTTIYQTQLEQIIAKTKGFDDSIIFSSGFAANLGTIVGLVSSKSLVIHDKLNHASLIDGTIMSGANMVRYKHNDIESLDKVLKENYDQYKGNILVITDGVFSMDGDIANIPEILKITKKYDVLLLIDEAHATGVIGEKGKGTLSHFNIKDRDNIIITGTLSKAIGTVGGFVSANQEIIDYLRIFSRSNMYSTSLPPSICASAIEVFKEMEETNIVEKLRDNYIYMREKLKESGFNTLNSETAIIPIIIGDENKTTMMSKDFLEEGIFTSFIFPPVIPPKLTRIRVSIMATHTKSDMDYMNEITKKIFKSYNIL